MIFVLFVLCVSCEESTEVQTRMSDKPDYVYIPALSGGSPIMQEFMAGSGDAGVVLAASGTHVARGALPCLWARHVCALQIWSPFDRSPS